MNQNETLDFSNVESAESGTSTWLKPGIYNVKPTAVELIEKEGKTSAIEVTFTSVNDEYEGQSVKENFFLSQKALPRLQYLHEAYLGFKLENKAISYQKLADYLSQKLLTKPKTVTIAVGGREGTDGKIYAQLPFSDFITEEEATGAYDEGSVEYTRSIRKQQKNAATMSNSAVLSGAKSSGNSGSDLPWND